MNPNNNNNGTNDSSRKNKIIEITISDDDEEEQEKQESKVKKEEVKAEVVVDDDDDIEVLWDQQGTGEKADIMLQYEQTKVGDTVYAPEKGFHDPWRKATVDKIIERHSRFVVTVIYSIDDDNVVQGKGVRKKTWTKSLANLDFKHLAYYDLKPNICEVIPKGIRVIAMTQLSKSSGKRYYSGIVAEIPKITNKNRYLVFFDTGHAKYITGKYVRMILTHEANPWADMNPDVQLFVKRYLSKVPEYPLPKRTRLWSIIQVEWNGLWWPARIIEIDCSLIRVELLENSLKFWLFKGSPRILENNKKAQREIRHYRKLVKSGQSLQPLQYGEEFEGKVEKHDVPKRYLNLIQFKESNHTCSISCSPRFPDDNTILRNVSPLAVPFYHGWDRGHENFGNSGKRIYYRTPCGRKLYEIDEIYDFLKDTSSDLQIDAFSIDYKVDCLAEFKPSAEAFIFEPDISEGCEDPRVERINAVDNLPAELFVYAKENMEDQLVIRCDDPDNFLIGCDCDGDCTNKETCSCRRLTYYSEPKKLPSGHDRFPSNSDVSGYENKKLRDEYVSGIYECNKMCKCSHTCFNKVVQQGLKYKLQIFKTAKKGYAIRAMQDIPEGAFLCVYTGLLMTGEAANMAGNQHGDEYLANLDLIEHFGMYKEGYEPHVIEPTPRSYKEGKRSTGKDLDMESSSSSSSSMSRDIERLHISSALSSSSTKNVARKSGYSSPAKIKRKRDEDSSDKMDTSDDNEDEYDDGDDEISTLRTKLFGRGEEVYVIDSKMVGNLSRYMNHSCDPNVWAQNVFVGTHDLRFPSCAFFTSKFVKCGTELTWNYNYQVGSVEGKKLDCNCGSTYCKRRLL